MEEMLVVRWTQNEIKALYHIMAVYSPLSS